MIESKAPDRIFLQLFTEFEGETTWCEHKQFDNDVEYVRADIVGGDKDDPLKDGQFRWVSVGGERNVAKVEEMLDEYDDLKMFFYTTDGCTWPKEELDFIGPVIHPPEI